MSQTEALAAAKKLVRTFASAPDPRRQARAVYSELARLSWSRRRQDEVDALGAWLLELPPVADLRQRCEQVLARLS